MKQVALTDTHCHLELDAFRSDLDDVLRRAWTAGLVRVLTIGIDLESSLDAVRIAGKDERIFAAAGIHPNSNPGQIDEVLPNLEALLENPKVVALGEIGLDYYHNEEQKDLQKAAFRRQLELASQFDLPVIIHTRNRTVTDHQCIEDTLAIVRDWCDANADKSSIANPGVFHSFSGNVREAKTITELGFYIGVSGPVTYKSGGNIRELLAEIPLERVLLETDAPFLTPHPFRGKRNEPAHVLKVAEKITEVYNLTLDEVSLQTTFNARNLFGWS